MSPSAYMEALRAELEGPLEVEQILTSTQPSRLYHYSDARGLPGLDGTGFTDFTSKLNAPLQKGVAPPRLSKPRQWNP